MKQNEEKKVVNRMTVRMAERKFATEPTLYGLFFEDINRSGDGGVYPELLRNRSFDDSFFPDDLKQQEKDYTNENGWVFEIQQGEGRKNWIEKQELETSSIPAWYAKNAQMELVTEGTLNKKRQAALGVDFQKEGSIENIGFCKVAVRENETYKLYFFAKTDSRVTLVCSIEDEGIVAEKEITVEGNEYIRYDAELLSNKTTKNARFVIKAKEQARVTFGFVSLMPKDTYKNHGLRKDLCEKLEALKPAFLRFPGGCIVEGFSKSTVQYFRRMVGPVWEREGVWNLWSYRSTEGLGYHEYLQLAEDLGAEPLYVCNCGMTCQARNCILLDQEQIDDLLQDVLDALEYARGGSDTKWGSLRAKMGHPEPFNLRYLEIGNENNGEDYEKRYEYFREKILEKYPDLIIIANTHVEEKGLKLDIADEHFYDRTEWFAAHADQYDKTDRKGPGIFVGEFAVVAGNRRTLYAALGEAIFMVGLERNQDIVKMAAYAPLFENVNYVAWEPNLIAFDGLDNYAIPSYYVWKLFGENRGKYVLGSETISQPLYSPDLQGGPCMLGAPGVKFKNPLWNGEPADKAVHELIGHMVCHDEDEKIYYINDDTEGQDKEHIKMFGLEGTAMVTLTDDETSGQGTFRVEVLAEKEKPVGIGIFAAPYGEREDLADSKWNLFTVQPIRWVIQDGMSKLTGGVGFRSMELAKEVPVSLEEGKYHSMEITTDGYKLSCILDGEVITEIELAHYDAVQAVAIDDEDEIIIKMVNISESDISVEISLDCQVDDKYSVGLLQGNPMDKNTMEEPHLLTDKWETLSGAASEFVYNAPGSSVSVLRLKKGQ